MSTANGSPSGGGRSIGQVFASITEDIASLVRDEIALAKAEVRQSLVRAGRGALLVNTAFIFLLITIGYALVAAGLPVWGAFLIVTLVLIAGAAVMVLVARQQFRRITGLSRTQAAGEATLGTLRSIPDKVVEAFEREGSN
jgi:hypothetical protein